MTVRICLLSLLLCLVPATSPAQAQRPWQGPGCLLPFE